MSQENRLFGGRTLPSLLETRNNETYSDLLEQTAPCFTFPKFMCGGCVAEYTSNSYGWVKPKDIQLIEEPDSTSSQESVITSIQLNSITVDMIQRCRTESTNSVCSSSSDSSSIRDFTELLTQDSSNFETTSDKYLDLMAEQDSNFNYLMHITHHSQETKYYDGPMRFCDPDFSSASSEYSNYSGSSISSDHSQPPQFQTKRLKVHE